jgi:hypothetical protein
MPESYLASCSVPVPQFECPRCPTCHAQMQLAQVKTDPSSRDMRTFECATCDDLRKALLPSDPMKSDTLGWLFADLHPPT